MATELIGRALTRGAHRFAMASALLAGVVLWLCLGSGSAQAAVPKFGMENDANQLCADSGSGAPGTIVKMQNCAEYSSHDGSYQEYWGTADLSPGAHFEAAHYYNDKPMCLTIRRGQLAVNTPLVMEPCGGNVALGQLFVELQGVGGMLMRASAESGRRVDNPFAAPSDYCVSANGGIGAPVVLARCNNRLTRQGWLGLGNEGSPGFPGPGDPTK